MAHEHRHFGRSNLITEVIRNASNPPTSRLTGVTFPCCRLGGSQLGFLPVSTSGAVRQHWTTEWLLSGWFLLSLQLKPIKSTWMVNYIEVESQSCIPSYGVVISRCWSTFPNIEWSAGQHFRADRRTTTKRTYGPIFYEIRRNNKKGCRLQEQRFVGTVHFDARWRLPSVRGKHRDLTRRSIDGADCCFQSRWHGLLVNSLTRSALC